MLLVHYADLDGQMRRLRERLGISVPDEHWAALARYEARVAALASPEVPAWLHR